MSFSVILLIVVAALSLIGIIWRSVSVSKQIQSTIYDLVVHSTDHRMKLLTLLDEMYKDKQCSGIRVHKALRSLERQNRVRRERTDYRRVGTCVIRVVTLVAIPRE